MTLLPKVKLKTMVSFPASVNGGAGIDVARSNGTYSISLAYSEFTPPIAISDPSNQNVLLWNTLTQSYSLTSVTSLANALLGTNPGNLYVATGGSDSNDGLSPATALLTLQRACTVAFSVYDLNGSNLVINIGAGSFTGAQINGVPPNSGNGGVISIVGAGSASTTITSTIIAARGANIQIGSLRITVASGSDILAQNRSTVTVGDSDLDLGPAVTALVNCYDRSSFLGLSGNNLKISGGASYGFLVSSLSNATLSANGTVTLAGTPNFSIAFVDAINNSVFDPGINSAFSGSATGIPYSISTNSVIDMENVAALPGVGAGSAIFNSSFYTTTAPTVTQITSRTTGVTIAGKSGQITMFTAAGSTTPQSFVVTNSIVRSTDAIVVSLQSGASNTYIMMASQTAFGNFTITFWTTGGVVSDTPIVNFRVLSRL